MQKALDLAEKGRGRTSPNPMVGAVIVQNGKIVGQGFHKRAGTPHAEIHALKEAGDKAMGADLYVTLEPCCHFGRTAPCTSAVIEAGIRRVVMAMIDPNPKVAGKGLDKLRRAGIETSVGLMANEAHKLNSGFIKYTTTGLPLVILKAASSLDGKIATVTGESKWITNPLSRLKVHEIRNHVDAILVGVGTVLADDPQLTVRLSDQDKTKDPVRIIVDSKGKTPHSAKAFAPHSSTKVIVATTNQIKLEQQQLYEKLGAEVLLVPSTSSGRVDLKQLISKLGQRQITSLLIEGGGEIHASAIGSGIVDEVFFFLAPILIGGREAPSSIQGNGIKHLYQAVQLKEMACTAIGQDLMVHALVETKK